MNKNFRFWIFVLAFIFMFAGCGVSEPNRPGNKADQNPTKRSDTEEINTSEDTFSFNAEVMNTKKGLLITPDPNSNEYKSSDQITVNTADSTIEDDTGNNITVNELKPGDIIEITYNGIILESYPAQIKVSDIKVKGHNILIDGYLAIINEIYQEDSGLNSDMEILALDTTGWAEITKPEKDIIIGEINKRYGVEVKDGSFDELAKDGLIDKKKLYFKKGILIKLKIKKYEKEKKQITFSIEKWKGGLGAIGWDDAKAKYKNSKWKIIKNKEWIS